MEKRWIFLTVQKKKNYASVSPLSAYILISKMDKKKQKKNQNKLRAIRKFAV